MKLYGGRYLQRDELLEVGVPVVGRDVQLHSTCVMVGLENLRFGDHVRVDAFCSLIAAAGSINIGSHVHIGSYAFLSGSEGITIGDFVSLSQGSRLYTRNDDYGGATLTGPVVPPQYVGQQRGPIRIGRHCIVGSGSIVLPQVEIGEGTTIGALSLIKDNLEPWGIYAGIPARRIRDREHTLLQLEARLLSQESSS
jgi:acetyltransferase-like isoleucine patch superfamily enzyme